MRRLAAIMLLAIAGIPASAPAGTGVPVAFLVGKHGEGLARTVAAQCHPARLPRAADMTFTVTDPFTATEVSVTGGRLPDGYVSGQSVPAVWWSENHAYGDTVALAIVNWMPLGRDAARHRRDLPPARTVGQVSFANAWWSAGTATLYGIETEVYAPPEAWRGALARKYFYMTTLYHSRILTPRAYMMLTADPYPGLTSYATDLLMEWHRACPPDAAEAEANDRAELLQGNRNPFVDLPDLAEHIWGDRKDTPYGGSEGTPLPLRSTYTTADRWIYLTSPHIPTDAVWSIDGRPERADKVSVTSLGKGAHHLTYTSASTRTTGRVMINITD